MKKIVALVLTLVLALSLATVAFAGTTTYVSNKVGGIRYLEANSLMGLSLDEVRAADAEKNLAPLYQINLVFGGKKLPLLATFVESTSDDYDLVFVSGKSYTYLNQSFFGAYNGEATAIDATEVGDVSKLTCGEYIIPKDGASLYLYKDTVMKAQKVSLFDNKSLADLFKDAMARIALVDGELVSLVPAKAGLVEVHYSDKTAKITGVKVVDEFGNDDTRDYAVVGHAYTADTKNVGGVAEITKVYCANCKAEFEFVIGSEKAAIKAFGADNYAKITTAMYKTDVNGDKVYTAAGDVLFADSNVEAALDGDQLWIKVAEMDGTDAAADGNKGVDSAKTFDAGVVLYAGMALMSVAGSAVVIGKKKEF